MRFPAVFAAIATASLLAGCTEKKVAPSSAAASPGQQTTTATTTAPAPGNAKDQFPSVDSPRADAAATSSTASPHRDAASAYLIGEGDLINDGALSIDRAAPILQSNKEFEKTMRRFGQGAATSSEAQDLIAHYKIAIERELGEKGVLRDFSCGLSLCLGSIRTRSPADYAAWSERFSSSAGAPSYSFGDITQKLNDDEFEGRFVFSTDPQANSVSQGNNRR